MFIESHAHYLHKKFENKHDFFSYGHGHLWCRHRYGGSLNTSNARWLCSINLKKSGILTGRNAPCHESNSRCMSWVSFARGRSPQCSGCVFISVSAMRISSLDSNNRSPNWL